MSDRKIAVSLGVGRGSVRNYRERAKDAGLCWPDVADVDDAVLERQLFTQTTSLDAPRFAEPDWSQIARELKKRGVSLQLLWEEYRANHPDDGYGYSAYCQRYRAWSKRLSPAMRQRHVAGEKMFVDYSGLRMAVTNPSTGVEVFVAVLGASNYAYVEASWSQSLPDWIIAMMLSTAGLILGFRVPLVRGRRADTLRLFR